MLKNPKISIITVVYNGAKTIEQAMQSVFAQTYRNVEYIVIDGSSIDGTIAIVEKYRDSIACFISEPDAGIYDAMNKGIRHATGDIVAFLNSDDWYEEETLQIVSTYFEDNEIDMLLGSVNNIRDDKKSAVIKPEIEKVLWTMPCCHQGVFAKRDLFQTLGEYDLKYLICSDYDWILKVYNSGAKIMCVDDVLANFRDDGFGSVQAYRRRREFIHIATQNAKKYGLHKVLDKIEEAYKFSLEEAKGDFQYELVCKNNISYLAKMFDKNAEYYIWGTGHYGRMCYKLLKKLGVKIKGFIDNNKCIDWIKDKPVFRPNQIDEIGKICVSTLVYEKEVLAQLQEMNIASDRVMCFSEVRNNAINYTLENYAWEEKFDFEL